MDDSRHFYWHPSKERTNMLTAVALFASLIMMAGDDRKGPIDDGFKPDATWKSLGKDIWFDAKTRQVIIRGRVALRDGALEHLICLKGTKDHESVISTEASPKVMHAGLLLTGAETGHPVRFEPKFEPPAGSLIEITVEWTDPKGKLNKTNAKNWVKDLKTNKLLDTDWVFAGSEVMIDNRTKEKFYAADDGDIVTVANFPSSMLDLPFRSSASDGDRVFVSNPQAVPERGTPVTVYFKPKSK
jgi:hypothetical protein